MKTLFKKLLPVFMFIICIPLTVAYGCGKKVTSVQLISSATTFNVGDVLDNDDFSIIVTYDNKETEIVKVTDNMLKEELPTLTNEGTFEIIVTYKDKDYTISITVVNPKKIESISVLNSKTTYETFDTFVANGSVLVNYQDETTATIEINNDMITQTPDLTTAGTKTVVVTYMNHTCEYKITVTERTQVSYEFKDVRVDYYNTATNQDIDLVGGKIIIKYSNGTSKTIDLTNDFVVDYPDFSIVGEGVIVLNINGDVFNLNVNISTDPEVLAYQKLMQAIKNVLENGLIENTTITGTIDINLDTRVLNDVKNIDKTIIGKTSLQGITDGYLNAMTKSLIEVLVQNNQDISLKDIISVLGGEDIDVNELTLIVNAIQKFVSTNANFDFYNYIESNQQLKAIKEDILFNITYYFNEGTFNFDTFDEELNVSSEFKKLIKVFEDNLYVDIVKYRTFDGKKLLNAIKEFAVDYANETQNLDQEEIAYRQELSDGIIKIIDNMFLKQIDYNHALSLFLRSTIDYKLAGNIVYVDMSGEYYDDKDIIRIIFNAEADIVEIIENVIVEAMKEQCSLDAKEIVKDIKNVLDNAIVLANEKEVALVAFNDVSLVLEKVITCMEDGRYIPEELANILIGLVQVNIYNQYIEYNDILNYFNKEIARLQEEYDYYQSEYNGYLEASRKIDNLIMEAEDELNRLASMGYDLTEIYEQIDNLYAEKNQISDAIFWLENDMYYVSMEIDYMNQEFYRILGQVETLSSCLDYSPEIREIILDYVHALSFGNDVDYTMLIKDILTAVELEEVLDYNFIQSFSGLPKTEDTAKYYQNFEIILESLNVVANDIIYQRTTSQDVIETINEALYNLSNEALVIAELYGEDYYLMFKDCYQEIVNLGDGIENASMSKAGKLFVNEIVEHSKYMVVYGVAEVIYMQNEYLDIDTFVDTMLQMITDLQDYYLLETTQEVPVIDEYLWTIYDVLEIRYTIEELILMTLYSVNPEIDFEIIYVLVDEFVVGLENQYRYGQEPVDCLEFVRNLSSEMGLYMLTYFIDNYIECGTPYIFSTIIYELIDMYYYSRVQISDDYQFTDVEMEFVNALETLSYMLDEYYIENGYTFEEKDEILMESFLTIVNLLDDVALIHEDVELYIASDVVNLLVYSILNNSSMEEVMMRFEPITLTLEALTMLNVEPTIDNYLDVKQTIDTIIGATLDGTITTKVIVTAIMNSKVLNSQMMMFIAQNLQISDEIGLEKLNLLNEKILEGLNTGIYNLQQIGEIYFDLAYTYGGENVSMYYAVGLATLVYMDNEGVLDYNKILQDKITPPAGIASIDYNVLINRILTKEAIENAIVISGINEVITYNDQDDTLDKQELSINITFDFDVTFIVFKGNIDFILELDF